MREMDRRVGLLRLLLADITDRERVANDDMKQIRGQLRRIVDFTVQFNGGVANALAAMLEVEERLAQQETTLRHLTMLRDRANGEIYALVVTRDIAAARARLDELEGQRAQLMEETPPQQAEANEAPAATLAEVEAEIERLRAAIEEASDAAARSLTAHSNETEEHGTGTGR